MTAVGSVPPSSSSQSHSMCCEHTGVGLCGLNKSPSALFFILLFCILGLDCELGFYKDIYNIIYCFLSKGFKDYFDEVGWVEV